MREPLRQVTIVSAVVLLGAVGFIAISLAAPIISVAVSLAYSDIPGGNIVEIVLFVEIVSLLIGALALVRRSRELAAGLVIGGVAQLVLIAHGLLRLVLPENA